LTYVPSKTKLNFGIQDKQQTANSRQLVTVDHAKYLLLAIGYWL